MRARLLGIITAVIIGAVGTGLLLMYARTAQDRAVAAEQQLPVLVVSQPVAAGTPVDELRELVTATELPAAAVADGRVTDLADHEGEVANVDLVPGEPLLASRLATPEELRTAGAVDVPDDHQQVTFSLEPQRAVGGQVAAGDRVGVFVSLEEDDSATHLVLHDVLVTNVQRDDTPPEPVEGEEPTVHAPPANNLLVTLALKGDAAPRAVYGAEFGRMWLSAEGATAAGVKTRVQTQESIHQ